ncbi:hypothetical protein JCM30760_26590 [Thiomicrorhabdus hydrogeniphila]
MTTQTKLNYSFEERIDSDNFRLNVTVNDELKGSGTYNIVGNIVWIDSEFEELLIENNIDTELVAETIENRKSEFYENTISKPNILTTRKVAYVQLKQVSLADFAEFCSCKDKVNLDPNGSSIHLTDLGGDLLPRLVKAKHITQEQVIDIVEQDISMLIFEF